jgi:hypothetical protein
MDQLFRALPSDLQWEVLSKFVGSHAVRKGKLMLKIVRDTRFTTVENIPEVRWCFFNYHNVHYNAERYVRMRDQSRLFLCVDPVSGERSFLFSKHTGDPYDDSVYQYRDYYFSAPVSNVVLPPFEKHSYPSYEYTDKKKKNRPPR